MSHCIPWDELAEGYWRRLCATKGRPSKDARLATGAVIIKHKLCLSDEETVAQIQENPHLQYFVGLSDFQMKEPFAPLLFVEIRKRMGAQAFDIFHDAIIEAVEVAKKKPASRSRSDKPPPAAPEEDDHCLGSAVTGLQEQASKQGKLILDATVCEQAIRYPTDLSLLNEARAFSKLPRRKQRGFENLNL